MLTLRRTTIIVVVFIIFTCLSSGYCTPCENSMKALDNALTQPPDEMTTEYIDSALSMCKHKNAIYKKAISYYKKWYKKELNPEKQVSYKSLAQNYYNQSKGIKTSDTVNHEVIASSDRDFNKVAFRALRPSTAGAVNTGLDMRINFKRNSHELTGDTSVLDQLGEVMMEDKNVTISLEGHTDQTGTLDYNNQLSVERAQTVRNYISTKYGIDPSRMQVAGYGYSHLLDKSNPAGALNRRVEVIKLSE